MNGCPGRLRLRTRFAIQLFWMSAMLAGCLSEDLIRPEPPPPAAPSLPSLACRPFIKTGYTEKVSYLPGERMRVYFQSTSQVDLCRVTVYNISGDSVFSLPAALPLITTHHPDASVDGFQFPVAMDFFVPRIRSGVYLIERTIPFIVKSETPVDVLIIYPSNTANAYAESGGRSLYSQNRAVAVSFQRPISVPSLAEVCLKWFPTLEEFTTGYVADMDVDFYDRISGATIIVVAGHSEYWTRQARLNFDRFVDEGGHALILSGNTMWWQVRYSEDASQMICYKDGAADPASDLMLKTVNWTDGILKYPILGSIGAHFPLGGYGLRNDKGWDGYKIVNPDSPLFQGLHLKRGDVISLPSLEYDGAPLAGFDSEGFPMLDTHELNFEKVELLGFDRGFRVGETVATFIVFKKTSQSGIVINTASTDWCSSNGMGGVSSRAIQTITLNAIRKLLHGQQIFAG